MLSLLKGSDMFAVNIVTLLCFVTVALAQPPPDPYIVCYGFPSDIEGTWPPGYNAAQYGDQTLNLCSAAYGRLQADGSSANMGCRCDGPNQPVVCRSPEADPNLFNWVFPEDHSAFRYMCPRSYCWCTTQAIAQGYADNNARGSAILTYSHYKVNGVEPYGTDDYWNDYPSESEQEVSDAESSTQQNCGQQECPAGNTTSGAASNDTCSSFACDSQYDCSDLQDCACKTNGTTYEPAANHILHFSWCTSRFTLDSAASLIGGRALLKNDNPCPCNTTYVSHACCDSRSGLVWEAPEMRLGGVYTGADL